jgi:hypothetical protein
VLSRGHVIVVVQIGAGLDLHVHISDEGLLADLMECRCSPSLQHRWPARG